MTSRPHERKTVQRNRSVYEGCLLASALMLLPSGSASAGGHFDVDDARMLDAGECQYEVWASRFRGAPSQSVTGQHVGPACRVGPVELGFNIDRYTTRGEPTAVWAGPQLKWTFYGRQDDAPLAVAVAANATIDTRQGGRLGGQFVIPVTWRASDRLQFHVNMGSDWLPVTGDRTRRVGMTGEWALGNRVSLIAERIRAFDVWTSRVGTRFALTGSTSVDLSASRDSDKVRGLIVGINQVFDTR